MQPPSEPPPKPPREPPREPLSEIDLEAGLRAAWARDPEPGDVSEAEGRSILESIESESGSVPRVLLRDEHPEHAASPLVVTSSPEARLEPTGKGNLQVLGEIARGGVGVVLKGRDTDLGRDVAIKVLREEHTGKPSVLHRFIEEAQIGGQLQHPGVVPVYELGMMPDKRPFFSMKLVNGRTLAEILAERSATADERGHLLSIFERVCQTMAYAHARGVIHRDLKPANVMVGAFGEVQVVDWGLSKVLRRGGVADEEKADRSAREEVETVRSGPGSDGTTSVAGAVMGTPAYMPPEQASGDPARVDERSDVFALGGILCEILTGKPPYRSGRGDALVKAATAQLSDAQERLEKCAAHEDLIRLAKWCLASSREERPRNADVVAKAIDAHLASVAERAQQDRIAAAEARVKVEEERRARRLTVTLGVTIIFFLVLFGSGGLWLHGEAGRRLQRTKDNVTATITEAVSHRAAKSWNEARSALQHARTLAGEGAATAELRARIAELGGEIDREARAAREEQVRERENLALIARLEEIRFPEGVGSTRMAWIPVGDRFAAIFEDFGLNIERSSIEAAAAAIEARGIGAELAGQLDSWARVRTRAGSRERAVHLTRVALLVDDDPTRSRLRRALLENDIEELVRFAEQEGLMELPSRTLNLLGGGLADARSWSQAIEVYGTSRLQHPDDFRANRSLALLHRQSDPPHPEEALRYYTAAISLRPENVEVRHQLGLVLEIDLGRYAEAAEVFRAALRLTPRDHHLLLHLGRSLHQAGDLEGAVAAFEECVQNEPVRKTSSDQIAWLLATAEDPARLDLENASRFARHATQVMPTESGVWDTLGVVQYKAGDWEGCITALEESMRLSGGGNAYPWFYLSICHAREGRLDEARQWIGRAVEWTEQNRPDDEELLGMRAQAEALLEGAGDE